MSNEVTNEAEDQAATPESAVDQNKETQAVETPAMESAEKAEQTTKSEPETETASEAPEDQQASGEMDFGAILEQFEQDQVTYTTGELVTGKVVGISEHGALVDFGYKSEGLVSLEEFTAQTGF